jgi:hypothetical protein
MSKTPAPPADWYERREAVTSPVDRIEALTGEILDHCAALDDEIALLNGPESWRLALGFVHGAESRLWRMERDMVDRARDLANKKRGGE